MAPHDLTRRWEISLSFSAATRQTSTGFMCSRLSQQLFSSCGMLVACWEALTTAPWPVVAKTDVQLSIRWLAGQLTLSRAFTLTMPLASMSKVTSIWGMPRGAGGMPTCTAGYTALSPLVVW